MSNVPLSAVMPLSVTTILLLISLAHCYRHASDDPLRSIHTTGRRSWRSPSSSTVEGSTPREPYYRNSRYPSQSYSHRYAQNPRTRHTWKSIAMREDIQNRGRISYPSVSKYSSIPPQNQASGPPLMSSGSRYIRKPGADIPYYR